MAEQDRCALLKTCWNRSKMKTQLSKLYRVFTLGLIASMTLVLTFCAEPENLPEPDLKVDLIENPEKYQANAREDCCGKEKPYDPDSIP